MHGNSSEITIIESGTGISQGTLLPWYLLLLLATTKKKISIKGGTQIKAQTK